MPEHSQNSKDLSRVGIVLLAAGASTRLGAPKQLLSIGGVSLIRRAAMAALKTPCRPVVVVLGAHREFILPEIQDLSVTIAENRNWQSGLASSIVSGLNTLTAENPDAEAALFMLCDQPRVTSRTLERLLQCYKNGTSYIVAAGYQRTCGVPALFSKHYFAELRTLSGDSGAKVFLKQHAAAVTEVDAPEAAIDVDIASDISAL